MTETKGKIRIKDCPLCGGGEERIGCREIITASFPNGKKKMKTWCYCRNCGHRGMAAVGVYDEEEAKRQAVVLWNTEG